MINYRITKYNPKFRLDDGSYTKDEWTSIHDIGKAFNGEILRLDEYLKTEQKYLLTYSLILEQFDNVNFKVRNLEKYSIDNIKFKSIYSSNQLELFDNVSNNLTLCSSNNILDFIVLILREHLWAKLVSTSSRLEISFGYDYYSYLFSAKHLPYEIIKQIEDAGLFVENMQ